MTAVDINRGTTGVVLPRTFAQEIWTNVREQSVALALTSPIDLPGAGLTIDMITGDPVPTWVGESEEVAVSRGTISTDLMTPYSMGVIVPFSNKFRRDKRALYNAMAGRLPTAIAKKIDDTIFRGTTPGSNFDVLSGATGAALNAAAGAFDDIDLGLVNAQGAIATSLEASGGDANRILYTPRLRTLLRLAQDTTERPKFYATMASGQVNELLDMPLTKSLNLYKADSPDSTHNVVGLMGDFSYAYHGVVESINVSMSDQATINDGGTTIHLWQRRMFALLIEVELGFVVRDVAAFRRLTELTSA